MKKMPMIRMRIENVKRGTVAPGWDGAIVLDSLSALDDGTPFWRDTNGQRHAWARDGFALVYDAPFQTQAVGKAKGGETHLLSLKNKTKGICSSSAGATLDIWECGTAVASVTCQFCRALYNIVGNYQRW